MLVTYLYISPKSLKPVKAVICHLPGNNSVVDVSNELMTLDFSVISVHQMTHSKLQPQRGNHLRQPTLSDVSHPQRKVTEDILTNQSRAHQG
jgi:hypothetical protein